MPRAPDMPCHTNSFDSSETTLHNRLEVDPSIPVVVGRRRFTRQANIRQVPAHLLIPQSMLQYATAVPYTLQYVDQACMISHSPGTPVNQVSCTSMLMIRVPTQRQGQQSSGRCVWTPTTSGPQQTSGQLLAAPAPATRTAVRP